MRSATVGRVGLLPRPLLDQGNDVLVVHLEVRHPRAVPVAVVLSEVARVPFGLAVVVAVGLAPVEGLADVEMAVDEAGNDEPTGGIYHLGRICRELACDSRNLPPGDPYVAELSARRAAALAL